MSHRRYQLDVFPRGAISTTGAPSFTLSSSRFRDAPLVGGQIVRPAQGTVESNPYRLAIVDVNSTFSARLADSSGRMNLLGRLARVKSSLNSTVSYSAIGVGRITDVALDSDVASYVLDVSDERWVERQTSVFTKSNTMSIVPYGNISGFQYVAPTPSQPWRCVKKTGNLVCLQYRGSLPIPTAPGIAQLIINDLKVGTIVGNTGVTVGNFNTLRWHNSANATDYEITAFGGIFTGGLAIAYPTSPLGFWGDPLLGAQGARDTPQELLYLWAVWTAGTPALGADTAGYLWAPNHEPTPELPQLIGGTSGLHPGRVVRQCYTGTHSPTTSQPVRFSTGAMDRWESDPAYGRMWWRAPAPAIMADFLDARIYGPYNVAPVTDTSGKIAPTRMWLPTSTQLNVAGLASITSTNALTHPTWEHPSGDIVNVIRYTNETYTAYALNWGAGSVSNNQALPRPTTFASTRSYDTVNTLGRRQVTFTFASVAPTGLDYAYTTSFAAFWAGAALPGIVDKLSNGMFQRFGDGPIYSQVDTSSAIDGTTNGAILPGAFVKVKLATFPNPAINARGSTRIMQVLQRDITPQGRSFRLLDVGANLNPLAAPTIALALSSQSSRHAIKVTVASVPVGARYEVQLAPSSSTGAASPPASSSYRWGGGIAMGTTASLTYVQGGLPSKTKFFGRVRASKTNRLGSAWSTATVSAVTASITAPSGLTASAITAGSAVLKWTNGSTLYRSIILVDATSNATLTRLTNTVATVPPATTRFTLLGLSASAKPKAGVQHVDDYGGQSAQATVVITTTTGYTIGPPMRGLVIVGGAA
jgi:hypothetical protein